MRGKIGNYSPPERLHFPELVREAAEGDDACDWARAGRSANATAAANILIAAAAGGRS